MDIITILYMGLPLALLIIYVLLNQFSSKTKTKADDVAKEIVGELLEGLGKEVPQPLDPLQVERDKAKEDQKK